MNERFNWLRVFNWLKTHGVRLSFAIVLIAQSMLLIWSARVHSPTWDEPGYLVAGLSHWKFGRFDLYSVNPPLVRTLATAPIHFFMSPDLDWSLYSSNPAHRTEVPIARAMIQDFGTKIYDYTFVARLMVIPIALLGSWFMYLLARDVFASRLAGVSAMVLWAFSPDILGYGSVFTPDVATTVAVMGCALALWRFLREPSWQWGVVLGLGTGVAMLCKSTLLILPVFYAVCWVILVCAPKLRTWESDRRSLVHQSAMLASGCVLALFVVNAFYGFDGSMKPIGQYEFVSRTFVGAPIPEVKDKSISRMGKPPALLEATSVEVAKVSLDSKSAIAKADCCAACSAARVDSSPVSSVCESCNVSAQANLGADRMLIGDVTPGNRFKDSLLASVPVPLPESYVQGIDVQRRDFEYGMYRPEWASYFAGEWKQGGWWYFYLAGILFKTPVVMLAFICIGMLSLPRIKADGLVGFLSIAVIVGGIFVIVSSNTGLNRYLRYSLPVTPLLIIVASGATAWVYHSRSVQLKRIGGLVLGCGLVATLGASLVNAPHWLSYFNALAGGPSQGHYWFADSNIDWGQDLKFVDQWLQEHPEARQNLHLAYFGTFAPDSVGIESQVPPPHQAAVTAKSYAEHLVSGPRPGWYVISKNYVIGHPMPVPAMGGPTHQYDYQHQSFTYFQRFNPVDSIGHSMLVYHLGVQEVNIVRRDLGMAPLRISSAICPGCFGEPITRTDSKTSVVVPMAILAK
jgi:4-amino-4-deoxy-L-arabinose transferase-like glycosyltransferase